MEMWTGARDPPPVAVISTESPLVIGGLGWEGDKRLAEQENRQQIGPFVQGRLVGAGPTWTDCKADGLPSRPSHTVVLPPVLGPSAGPWGGHPASSPSAEGAAVQAGL